MDGALVSAARAIARRAVDADVKVILVTVSMSGFDHHFGSAAKHHGMGVASLSLFEQPRLQVSRDKNVLNPGVTVRDELRDELPVASIVKAKTTICSQRKTVRTKRRKRLRCERPSPRVQHVEREVRVAAALVGQMSAKSPAGMARKLAHREPRTG